MTPDFPLHIAQRISALANAALADGSLFEQVSPTTAELLRYWFAPSFTERRAVNFHAGQRQAILNVVYLHEVVRATCVLDVYEHALATDVSLPRLTGDDRAVLAQEKYCYAKYALKMATGTGKTWVMHALMIWQVLNAHREATESGRFTRHFLVVAPGLIVYDRLKDAYQGRLNSTTMVRDVETSDFHRQQELFLPERYRQEMFSFLQNNTVTKEEGIGRKTTGGGLIALTNWHLFLQDTDSCATEEEEDEDNRELSPTEVVETLLPLRPGSTAGNALDVLDARFLRGSEMVYLHDLPSLMIINDEAHHIHDNTTSGEDVKWQQGIDYIMEGKQTCAQIDFSATPYTAQTVGRGKQRHTEKHYFYHIVVDYALETAIRTGLVKTLLIDRRQSLTTELASLDFKAVREGEGRGAKVVGLSDGQRVMLRAGLQKLRRLETDFVALDRRKHPKMLVMCEDTKVTPFVEEFLCATEGLAADDVLRIDSNSKGEMVANEWLRVKERLFNLDHYERPRVVVSVLMLREGFDVSNICVIVPLRASSAPILLEQTIGRGLRLMWREPLYTEVKRDNRERVLLRHEAPQSMIDMLTIIEHPAFEAFYDDLMREGLASIDARELATQGNSVGDLMRVGLREDYARYDMAWPTIVHEAEEELPEWDITPEELAPYTLFSLEQLRAAFATEGERFVSKEVITGVQFGGYKVGGQLFDATSYNEYLGRLVTAATMRGYRVGNKLRPMLQINEAEMMATLDAYIRTTLFAQPFNPMAGNDWKILLAKSGNITQHILKELHHALFRLQENTVNEDAEVDWTWFSSVSELRMRESASLELVKTLYLRTHFASASSGLERRFAQWLDRQASVERFLKIDEYAHPFAVIFYLRTDGLLARYYPDFLVETSSHCYLIETKATRDITEDNVVRKRHAATEWCARLNQLPTQLRRDLEWAYLLVSESLFEAITTSAASFDDLCQRCTMTVAESEGRLF